jgi:hypothetical protein
MLFPVCVYMSVLLAGAAGDPQLESIVAQNDLVGVVTDISSVPIPQVEVSIVKPAGMSGVTHTSNDGKFVIGGVPTGMVSVQLRRLGYEARVVDVEITAEKRPPVEIVLKPVPAELDELLIRAEERSALREFYEHKTQRSSYGKFFEAADIKKRGASHPSDLFRSIPGVRLTNTGSSTNAVTIRGCTPMLWIDGQRVPNSEVDDVVSTDDIAGLEFYISMAGTPAPYLDRSTRACGSILVWTKNR